MSPTTFRVVVVSLALGFSGCAANIHPTVSPPIAASRMGELWEKPTAISTRDLLNGPWGVQDAPNADAIMYRGERMSQFVQYHAGKKCQQSRRMPQQTGGARIRPAHECIYGQQQEEGEVHRELNPAHPEKVH